MARQYSLRNMRVYQVTEGLSMSTNPNVSNSANRPSHWRELFAKEDWWAVWIGLGLVIVAAMLFANSASLKWIAVTPQKWSTLDQIATQFGANATRYLALFGMWLVL